MTDPTTDDARAALAAALHHTALRNHNLGEGPLRAICDNPESHEPRAAAILAAMPGWRLVPAEWAETAWSADDVRSALDEVAAQTVPADAVPVDAERLAHLEHVFTTAVNAPSVTGRGIAVPHYQDVDRIWAVIHAVLAPAPSAKSYQTQFVNDPAPSTRDD